MDHTQSELLELNALLLDTNKQFTESLKAKKPHSELVDIYNQIQAIYSQIDALKKVDFKVTATNRKLHWWQSH